MMAYRGRHLIGEHGSDYAQRGHRKQYRGPEQEPANADVHRSSLLFCRRWLI